MGLSTINTKRDDTISVNDLLDESQSSDEPVTYEIPEELLFATSGRIDHFDVPDNPDLDDDWVKGLEIPSEYFSAKLAERGFYNLPEDLANKLEYHLTNIESQLGVEINLNDLTTVKGVFRSKQDLVSFNDLREIIDNSNAIQSYTQVTPVDDKTPLPEILPSMFDFNPDFESPSFDLTHVAIDTEADYKSEPIIIQCHNLEANRSVIGVLSDKYEFTEYQLSNGTSFIYLKTPNLNDAVLLADIETLLSGVFLSALHQGHKELDRVFEIIIDQYNLPTVNYSLIEEILLDKRRSLYLYQNAKYDIKQLKFNHSQCKGRLNVLGSITPEKIAITEVVNEDAYHFYLGNTQIGFRYNLSARKFGSKTVCKQKISPAQAESYPLTFLCDTLILAMALKFRPGGYSLKHLSKNTLFEKREFDNQNKIFSVEDFPDPFKTSKFTDAFLYGMYDTYALISAYEQITKQLYLSEIEEVFYKSTGIEMKIERKKIPWCTKILSTASISKTILFAYLEKLTNQSIKQIERHIKQQRIYFRNYEYTYMAGKVEAFIFGLIKNTKYKKLFYIDFNSLYPHVAWLIEVFKIYELASKGLLDKYQKNDIYEGSARIKQSVKEILHCIKHNRPLQKETFKRLIGTVSIFTKNHLLIATRAKNENDKGKIKRTEAYIIGDIPTTMSDLVTAIVRDILKNKRQLDDYFNPHSPIYITFKLIDYVDLDEFNSKYDEEPATAMYIQRGKIQSQAKKETDQFKKTVLDSTQNFIKFFLNTGSYGIGAEGISNEDYTGILFISVIGNPVPAVSRAFTNLVEIANEYYDGQNCYCDTDSLFTRTTPENLRRLLYLFSETINLKDEISSKDKTEFITQLQINGKKRWGILTNHDNIINKIHGKGQYQTQSYEYVLDKLYRLNFEGNFNNTENALKVAKHHSIHQQVSLDSTNSSIYKGLKEIANTGKIIYEFTYKSIPLVIHYNHNTDSYVVSNVHKIRIGQFGHYFNATPKKQSQKLQFFIAIPLPIIDEFDDSVFYIEENDITNNFNSFIMWFFNKFYVENSDLIFQKQKINSTWYDFYKLIIELNQDWIHSEVNQLPQDFDATDILEGWEYYWKKLCEGYKLNWKTTLSNNGLELFEKINTYDNLDLIINQISPENINILDEIEIQPYDMSDFDAKILPVYEMYHNIAAITKGLDRSKKRTSSITNQFVSKVRNKEISFKGIEKSIQNGIEIFYKREHIIKKLANYFSFDNDKIRRYIDYEKETFKVTRPFKIDKPQTHPVMKNINKNLHRRVNTDGTTYYFYLAIENVSLTTMLKADLDAFYTKNALDTAYAATKVYFATHKKLSCISKTEKLGIYNHDFDCDSVDDCEYLKSVYGEMADLPTPKRGRTIAVPLKFQVKPILKKFGDTKYLPIEYAEAINPMVFNKMLDKGIVTEKNNRYIVNEQKYATWEAKQFDFEWYEMDLWNKRFSISIEKFKSSNYNSVLYIDILPNKANYALTRNLSARLHVNPFSFDLINLNLFETSIQECLDNTQKFKPLFTSLYEDIELHTFKRNASVTVSDWKKKPYSQIETFHHLLAKQIILSKLDRLDVKLTQLTVSKQYETQLTNNHLMITLFIQTVMKKYEDFKPKFYHKNGTVDFKKSAKELLQHGRELMVYPIRSSAGIHISNLKQKWGLTIYWKNKRWARNKILRVGNKKELSDAQMIKILETPIPENLIRFEVAFFGFDSILLAEPENVLIEVLDMIKSCEKLVYVITHNPQIKKMLDDLDDNVPTFFYDRDIDIFELNQPPPPVSTWT